MAVFGKAGIWGGVAFIAACAPAWSQDDDRENRVRGVVEPVAEAFVSARVSERIVQIPAREGETFVRGDVLVKFDCSELSAQKRVAVSKVNAAALDANNKRRLRALKAIGSHDVRMAEAELNMASAESKVIDSRLANCQIEAPFDGKVSAIFANAFENPPQDGRLLSIVSNGDLELKIIVPSNWLAWLAVTTKFEFVVDETGRRYRARVAAVGGKVDPVSQTVSITADIEDADQALLPGMSGEAVFPSGSDG